MQLNAVAVVGWPTITFLLCHLLFSTGFQHMLRCMAAFSQRWQNHHLANSSVHQHQPNVEVRRHRGSLEEHAAPTAFATEFPFCTLCFTYASTFYSPQCSATVLIDQTILKHNSLTFGLFSFKSFSATKDAEDSFLFLVISKVTALIRQWKVRIHVNRCGPSCREPKTMTSLSQL